MGYVRSNRQKKKPETFDFKFVSGQPSQVSALI